MKMKGASVHLSSPLLAETIATVQQVCHFHTQNIIKRSSTCLVLAWFPRVFVAAHLYVGKGFYAASILLDYARSHTRKIRTEVAAIHGKNNSLCGLQCAVCVTLIVPKTVELLRLISRGRRQFPRAMTLSRLRHFFVELRGCFHVRICACMCMDVSVCRYVCVDLRAGFEMDTNPLSDLDGRRQLY